MAYTLNTGHALYGNLVELIGVQGGALVSHKTARTITPESGSSFGTGTWGEHFHTNGYSYTSRGATISPAIGIDTSTIGSYTIVVVVNGSGNINNGHLLIGTSSQRLWGPRLLNGHIGWRAGLEGSTAVGTGARMLTSCRIGETGGKLYLDKTLEASSVALGADYNDPGANANYLGSADQTGISDIVWAAVFNKELTLAEITDLYNSLGAANAFGLVESGGSGASAAGGTGTSSGSGSGGVATGGAGGTGSFTFPSGENNTHSGAMSGVAVNWAWHSGGAVGAASVITNGTGTMTTGGMTISGLPTGVGYGVLRSSDGTVIGYREGTVS